MVLVTVETVNSMSCSTNTRWSELCDIVCEPAGSCHKKMVIKYHYTSLHHRQHPELWIQSRMDSRFHGIYTKFWPWNPNECCCSSSTSCAALRGALLNTLVAARRYFSYCCLPIKAVWLFSSDLWYQRGIFTGYFLFFRPFPVNPRVGCVWKFH